MKKMKKLLLILAMVLISLPVFSNGQKESSDSSADSLHFVYVSPLLSHPVWLIAKEGFDQACDELKITGDWVGPQGISAEEMAQLVDTAVAQKADGIITQSICPAEPINNAISKNIPVILVDGDLEDVPNKLAFLGKDLDKQAELMYEKVLEYIPKDQKIVASLQCAALNAQIYIDQNEAIKRVFEKHPGGFELTNVTLSAGDKAKALTEWQNTFNTYPEINVALNVAAEAASACVAVSNEMGLQDKVIILGVDDTQENLDLIGSGDLDGVVVSSFFNYGYQAAYWLYQNITEGRTPVNKRNDAGTYLVTKANLDTYGALLKQRVDLPAK